MPKITRRQKLTATAVLECKTQLEIAREFGISQSAVSRRMKRFEANLTSEQAENYRRAISPGRKFKVMPISFLKGGV